MKIFIITAILACIGLLSGQKLYAYSEIGFLKGGISSGVAEMNSLGKKDFLVGAGFNTHAGYRWTNWEFQLSSYIYVGKMNDKMAFDTNGERVVTNGTVRSVSFLPMMKRFTKYEPKMSWKLYFSAGPMLSLQSIYLKDFTRNDGVRANNYKTAIQSYGAGFAVGVEEFTKYKEMHPVYIEFMYQVHRSHKTFLDDLTDTKMVRTIRKDETGKKIMNQMIILSFGMTVF